MLAKTSGDIKKKKENEKSSECIFLRVLLCLDWREEEEGGRRKEEGGRRKEAADETVNLSEDKKWPVSGAARSPGLRKQRAPGAYCTENLLSIDKSRRLCKAT